jgi:hypothetical protein
MVTDEEILDAELSRYHKEYREPNITFLMLADMFGDDESARRLAQTRIRSLTRQRNQLLRPSLLVDKDRRWVRDEVNKFEAEQIDKQIKFYNNFLNASNPTKKEEMKKRGVSETDIARAKEVPIVDLLESYGVLFVRDFAVCPWHGEKTASLHYIKERNTCYCQGCHKHVDSITVVQHFRNVNFIEAVKSLI